MLLGHGWFGGCVPSVGARVYGWRWGVVVGLSMVSWRCLARGAREGIAAGDGRWGLAMKGGFLLSVMGVMVGGISLSAVLGTVFVGERGKRKGERKDKGV